jgi:hypothetical protein
MEQKEDSTATQPLRAGGAGWNLLQSSMNTATQGSRSIATEHAERTKRTEYAKTQRALGDVEPMGSADYQTSQVVLPSSVPVRGPC